MTEGRLRHDEGSEAKADRLIAEGKVEILTDEPDSVAARVRGDNGDYRVTGGRGGFSCSCRTVSRCSHLVAVLRQTVAGQRLLHQIGGDR